VSPTVAFWFGAACGAVAMLLFSFVIVGAIVVGDRVFERRAERRAESRIVGTIRPQPAQQRAFGSRSW